MNLKKKLMKQFIKKNLTEAFVIMLNINFSQKTQLTSINPLNTNKLRMDIKINLVNNCKLKN